MTNHIPQIHNIGRIVTIVALSGVTGLLACNQDKLLVAPTPDVVS